LAGESERLAQNYIGVRKLLPGSVAWSEAITGASSAASEISPLRFFV
jgi:hypothetical protein